MGESLSTSVWSKMAKLTLLTGECCCKLELSAPGQGWGLGHCCSAAGMEMLLSPFCPRFHHFLWGGKFLFFRAAAFGDLFCFEHGQSSLQGRIEMCCQTEI